MKNLLSRSVGLCAVLGVLSGAAPAGTETIEIAKVQVVKLLAGVVRDHNGDPVAGATVVEISADWKTDIQRTVTDATGHFALPTIDKRKVHNLKISKENFDPLVVHVRISRWKAKLLNLQLHVAN